MSIPAGHPLLERIVADAATEPEKWVAARPSHIGASDAAKYAKVESIEKYVRSKLTPSSFSGNSYTANGHRLEADILRYIGVTHNTRMFHHPDIPEFTATPDGINVTGELGIIVNAEVKVKHHEVEGPTIGEFRQIAWAQFVTGAAYTKFAWQHVDKSGARLELEPHVILVDRDEAMIEQLLEIAYPVRAALLAAEEFKREANHE